jgi:hypothetical protein
MLSSSAASDALVELNMYFTRSYGVPCGVSVQ